jgi:trehalose 6-phosphate phosphatase
MQALKANLSVDRIFETLSNAQKSALLLDYDGTLAPFRQERDEAFPYPGIAELLDSIIGCERTRLVIISGRRARDLTGLMHLKRNPEI